MKSEIANHNNWYAQQYFYIFYDLNKNNPLIDKAVGYTSCVPAYVIVIIYHLVSI